MVAQDVPSTYLPCRYHRNPQDVQKAVQQGREATRERRWRTYFASC